MEKSHKIFVDIRAIKRSKEENELKIKREMCLHILWNILNKQALYNYLFEKYHSLGADLKQVFITIEEEFNILDLKKEMAIIGHHIQLLHLWKCYQAWINEQIIYMSILYKTRYGIQRRVRMLSNGKWKACESAFDYEHRTIMLFNEKKLKIKSLQVGNPMYIFNSIMILTMYMTIYQMDLYCGKLCNVQFKESETKLYCGLKGISPFKHEREISFARSFVSGYDKETTYKGQIVWSAKIESEDEYTQMILLTWTRYDQYIEQIMKISAILNHAIAPNIIYAALLEGKITLNKKKKEFIERRCCNCNINLFLIIEIEAIYAIHNGLPFIEKDKKKWKITKK
ncbi:hypothetical protein RFI_09717 [Reticulomyxa filosa]|uniref:Uncharacterized protein n=1 Tax=Reticulomyxa filosa TaxID=46433 RepID=X6NP10_RETFI|nr:hypothetical protein RFI_09717 [Reticulomyxa filosa]|eukprot:ETO27414.1 hypothetical protein RFI_09717 [Reticulomyxa filosa]